MAAVGRSTAATDRPDGQGSDQPLAAQKLTFGIPVAVQTAPWVQSAGEVHRARQMKSGGIVPGQSRHSDCPGHSADGEHGHEHMPAAPGAV